MRVKAVSGIMLTLLLTSMLTLAFNIQLVEAEPGPIYIRADGSVDPPTANITSADNITYYFTDNNYDEIVVERSNIIVDGNGSTLQGPWNGYGFNLTGINNVTIQNTNIKDFYFGGVYFNSSSNGNTVSGNNITNNHDGGVLLYSSSNNTVSGNNITNNPSGGVLLYSSSYNTVSGNNITNNHNGVDINSGSYNTVSGNTIANSTYGVSFHSPSNGNTVSGNTITNNTGYGVGFSSSNNNTVSGNNITNNDWGVWLYSSNNTFYHNNFVNNTLQTWFWMPDPNFWNSNYPSGGNYWSNYAGVDLYSGPYQNETGSDGIGDTPHVLTVNNQDNYPLINPWSVRDVAVTEVLPNKHGHEKHYAYQTWTINVNVTVLNNGTTLANITVTAYYNESSWHEIGNQTITNLAPDANTTVTFDWNLEGLPENTNYTVKANVTLLDDVDTNPANNEKVDGQVKIRFWGDVNGDDAINILDLKLVKLAYSGLIENQMADLDGNGVINILDVKLMKLIYSGIL